MKEIKLTQGKITLVDDSDYEKLSKFKWFANKSRGRIYAVRSIIQKDKRITVMMHRIISKCPVGFEVDHIDGDGLNNQKKNLRICTHSQNLQNRGVQKNNTSGFKGITWHRIGKKWQSEIRINGKFKYLGLFKTKLAAYQAYCDACLKYHGEFSRLK